MDMREKIYRILNRAYGVVLMGSFFAGLLPLIPFIVAICIGGDTGAAISTFLYKQYYPWVIAAAASSVFIGWVASYFKKNPKKDRVASSAVSTDKKGSIREEKHD